MIGKVTIRAKYIVNLVSLNFYYNNRTVTLKEY